MLFRASAKTVAAMAMDGSLFFQLTEQFFHQHGHGVGSSEARSWERSIPALVTALNEAGLGDVEVLLEYALPLNSKRADAVLAGRHPATGEPSYVVVELKQWGQAEPDEEDAELCHVGRTAPVLNPIEQVRRYCQYLVNFNGALAEHPHRVSGVAYLHNATEFGVAGLRAIERDDQGQMFTGQQRGEFLKYLRSKLSDTAPGAPRADELLNGKQGPSKQLMAIAAQEVREREQFVLLDEQQVAYRMVLNAVRKAKQADSKEVVVVTGGPGTGKSVIALSLLGELYRQGISALHATGSQAFTKTMRKVAGFRKREVQDLFKYFNSFMAAEKNSLDVLICDEAHRMRETSANRYTSAALRTGKPQVEELIDAARVPVFLLDQHQVVRPGELGTEAEIRAAAEKKNLACTVIPLDSQFRCGGSDAYLRWVVRLLGLEEGGPVVWEPDDRMELRIADSPEEMERFLDERRAQGFGARMSAGYCWTWSPEPKPGEPLPADVVIGDWARPWNLRGDRGVAGAPPSALWATDPAGFGQVGCVYTAQGFEYDWSGVIIGPDLLWRGDRWITDRTVSKDPAFTKTTSDDDVDRLIRNTYKVLLTRGMVGTVVHSTDPETQAKLRELVGAQLETAAV
ncbi:DNA/RNA helicase domain-containing protein [Streptomyces sp. AA1529]|uniref:DNA/RNA helicase domain-containing protein n=1 Tax=Streptomyces sp. AA1529 TaxID=1203257 RepID=UPI0004747407|nr:DNA/RNA helicase domain-containing protein [Streptomyces sp. AA1529]